jgi:hypothetical protein
MKFEQKPFGKLGRVPESSKREQDPEARFKQVISLHESKGTTGDSALDELVSDYVGIQAFNEVAGVIGDMAALERDKNLILSYLKEHPEIL